MRCRKSAVPKILLARFSGSLPERCTSVSVCFGVPQRAAGANELNARVYARLNLGLATWAALSLVLSLLGQKYFQRPALL